MDSAFRNKIYRQTQTTLKGFREQKFKCQMLKHSE